MLKIQKNRQKVVQDKKSTIELYASQKKQNMMEKNPLIVTFDFEYKGTDLM